ncbi:MAG: 4'-phosphopantetheinyl transferase superfamily protein [Treponema sp.]|nr:4'-phosphopantetheinyl transferase superfamily protein [Treponema sp.]
MSYYIGLSILSNNSEGQCKRAERQKFLSAEAKCIVSRLADKAFSEDDIARERQGRPFFLGPDLDFSISHSGTLAAVSFVRGANLRTGCDVELVRPRVRAKEIAEENFSAPERDYIFSSGCFDETKFYSIWTLKECYLKLRGLQVFDMPGVPSFIDGEDPCRGNFVFCTAVPSLLLFRLYELSVVTGERYMLATVIEGMELDPEIRWFSQASTEAFSPIRASTLSAKIFGQTKQESPALIS